MRVLVTGGAGFIGSHTCLALLGVGHDVVVLDNLCNSSPHAIKRVQSIAGRSIAFVEGDVRDAGVLRDLFAQHAIDAVIHFAGLKAVGESVREPGRYYDNNFVGTLRLVEAMQAADVRRLVFSSSATVYGSKSEPPFNEDAPLGQTNPYGRSKFMAEQFLTDSCAADARRQVMLLRYFNPVGAHESGLIGEEPNGIPNNLMPFITQVAVGRLKNLSVFGSDYATRDGTGVRDYIHVMDVAEGHVAALNALPQAIGRAIAVNLGTGRGHSVLEVVKTFEQVNSVTIPFTIVDRRPGDVAASYADVSLATRLLGWQAKRDPAAMCRDAWNWQHKNPDGYKI